MSSATVRSTSKSNLAAFVIGVPMGVALTWAIMALPAGLMWGDFPLGERAHRYLHHPVEKVELVMFCAAMAALGAKMLASLREKSALGAEIVPAWDRRAVPPAHAAKMLETHAESLESWSGTWLGRRYLAVLDFVKGRGSAAELDDHVRTIADADAMSHDASYSLVRFITWAIPILGFIGTVLGITDAISNIDPKEMNMASITGGLSLAFDATALGLGLTMVLMFFTFLVERREQSVLEQVDAVVEAELSHRFVRTAADHAPLLSAVEAGNANLMHTAEMLVARQAEIWSKSLEKIASLGRESAKDQHAQLSKTLEHALQTTLAKHAQRLVESEAQVVARQEKMLTTMAQLADVLHATSQKHQQGLSEVSQRLAQQTAALVGLQQTGAELTRLQETLTQNLNALAGAGAFDQAVQSLTAAIHLLTTRVAPGAQPASPKKVA